MENLIYKTLRELTIQDIEAIAKENTSHYVARAKKIAEQAFTEGVLWAQKTHKEHRSC